MLSLRIYSETKLVMILFHSRIDEENNWSDQHLHTACLPPVSLKPFILPVLLNDLISLLVAV